MAQYEADLALVNTTLNSFEPKGKVTDLASTLQEYVAMNALMSKNRMTVNSGPQFQFQVRVATGGNATFTKPGKPEATNDGAAQIQGLMPHRHWRNDFKLDERTMAANREPGQLYDLLKDQREQSEIDLAELMENAFWGIPDPNDANDESFHGVKYWITAIGATSTLGLNGGLPTGYTAVGNISPTTHQQWSNYNGLYGSITKTGLIRMARRAARLTGYKPPVNSPSYSTGYKHGYYTNLNVISTLEEELEKQNQNLGNDIASKDGTLVFRKTPVEWVPKLDEDTANPFYGIDWGSLKFRFLKGEVFKELPAIRNPICLREIIVRRYGTGNLTATNRRTSFVLTQQ